MASDVPAATRSRSRARATPASGRAAWGTISREQVVQAATRLVSTAGYEQFTLRGLAAELGVAPMSLYRHVRDKDDLLDEVVDRLFATAWQPHGSPEEWQTWIGEAAEKLRCFLVDQPAALHVYLRHPVVSSTALARMEAVIGVLRRVTGQEDDARRAYAAIHTYTIGFAALEASRSGWQPAHNPTEGLAHQLAAYTTPSQFADGLNYLLEGIAASRGLSR